MERISRGVLEHGLPEGVCLNVNVPDVDSEPEEMRVVRACRGNWSDEYKEYTDPHGHKFYWLTGVRERERKPPTRTNGAWPTE